MLRGHRWSQWYNYVTEDKQYHYCYRCSEIEYRIGLKVVKANPKGVFRNIFKWFISLGKPSWEDSVEEAASEGQQQWYYHIPRDELNEAIKCLANELSNIEDFDSPRLWLCKECRWCRYQLFCESIIRSMRKAFKKYEREEEVQKRGVK